MLHLLAHTPMASAESAARLRRRLLDSYGDRAVRPMEAAASESEECVGAAAAERVEMSDALPPEAAIPFVLSVVIVIIIAAIIISLMILIVI